MRGSGGAYTTRFFAYYEIAANNGQAPSTSQPILLSAKETTHLTLFNEEVSQWKDLAGDRVVMSIRNPVLQMRSALLMILDNIDTDIFSEYINMGDQGSFTQEPVISDQFNVPRNGDVREYSIHGKALLDPVKLNLLLESNQLSEDRNGKLNWPDTYDYIKAGNDFSLFNDTALKRLSIYNPFMEEPEVQREIWKNILSPQQYADAESNYAGIRMEDFYKLPAHLCDALFRWRMGWMPTLMHLKNKSYPNLIVSEFTQMQMNSENSWSEILGELRSRDLIPVDGARHLEYDICVDKQCELPWKAWFLDQDYKTVLGHRKMTKPRNKPMIENQLPACLQELLPEAREAYRLALSYLHVVGVSDSLEASPA